MQALLLTANNLQGMSQKMTVEETKLHHELSLVLSNVRKERELAVQSKRLDKIEILDEQVRKLTGSYMQIRHQVRRRVSSVDKAQSNKRMQKLRQARLEHQKKSRVKSQQHVRTDPNKTTKTPDLTTFKIECIGCQGPRTGLCSASCPFNTGISYRVLMGED